MTTLTAAKRDMSIKSKRLRREGSIPGNIVGREMKETMPITIPTKEAERFIKENAKGKHLTLDVDGKNIDVLLKEVNYNAFKKEIENIDFQALVAGEKVHSTAQIVLLNHDKVQGALVQNLDEIAYKAFPSALVEKVEIDLSGMKAGMSLKVGDLEIAKDKDIDLVTPLDKLVVSVTESQIVEEVADDTAEAAK